jgi:hypothetical protein
MKRLMTLCAEDSLYTGHIQDTVIGSNLPSVYFSVRNSPLKIYTLTTEEMSTADGEIGDVMTQVDHKIAATDDKGELMPCLITGEPIPTLDSSSTSIERFVGWGVTRLTQIVCTFYVGALEKVTHLSLSPPLSLSRYLSLVHSRMLPFTSISQSLSRSLPLCLSLALSLSLSVCLSPALSRTLSQSLVVSGFQSLPLSLSLSLSLARSLSLSASLCLNHSRSLCLGSVWRDSRLLLKRRLLRLHKVYHLRPNNGLLLVSIWRVRWIIHLIRPSRTSWYD